MKEIIKRHLNLKYLIPFIVNELIFIVCTLVVYILFQSENYSLMDLLSTIVILIFMYFFFRKDFKEKSLILDKDILRLIIKYTVLLFSLNIICTFIENILSSIFNVSLDSTNQSIIIEMFYYNYLTVSISAILAGITEEMLYRYSIFKLFKNRKLAFIMSWLIFAFGHFSGFNPASYISMIGYLTLSFVLTYIYYKYDDIRIVCGIHVLNNTLGVIEMFILLIL
ncbi:MAG: lysostaphin resistance A-like protein [Erysipelotrichaceae bacterium]